MNSKPPSSRKSVLKISKVETNLIPQENKKRKFAKESPSSVLNSRDVNVYVSKSPSPVVHKRRVSFCDTISLQKDSKPSIGLLNFDDEKENNILQDNHVSENIQPPFINSNISKITTPVNGDVEEAIFDDDNMSVISADDSCSSDSNEESASESDVSSGHDVSEIPDYDEEMSFTGAFGKILFEAKKKLVPPTEKTIVFSSQPEEDDMEMTAVFGKICIQTPEEIISQLEEHTSHSLIEDLEQERENSLNSSLEPQEVRKLSEDISRFEKTRAEEEKLQSNSTTDSSVNPSIPSSVINENMTERSSKTNKLLSDLRRLSMPVFPVHVETGNMSGCNAVEEKPQKRRLTVSQSIRQLSNLYGSSVDATSTAPLSHQALLKHNNTCNNNMEETLTVHSNLSMEFTNTSINSLREAYTPKRRISELKRFASFTPSVQQEDVTSTLPVKLDNTKVEETSPYCPISTTEFLNRCNTRFMDELSSSRRIISFDSVSNISSNFEKASSLGISIPLFRNMDRFAVELEQNNMNLKAKVEELESELSSNNPVLFKYVQSLSKEQLSSFTKRLLKLKQKAKLKSKLMQYDWKLKYEQGLNTALKTSSPLFTNDMTMLNEHQKYLDSLKHQIASEIESTKQNISRIQSEKFRMLQEQVDRENIRKQELEKIAESEDIPKLVAKLQISSFACTSFYSISSISDSEIVLQYEKLNLNIKILLNSENYCNNCSLHQKGSVSSSDPAISIRNTLIRTFIPDMISKLHGIPLPQIFIHFSNITSCLYRIYLLHQELNRIIQLKQHIILKSCSNESRYAIQFMDFKLRRYSFEIQLDFSPQYPFHNWNPSVQFIHGAQSLQALVHQTIEQIPKQLNRSLLLVHEILRGVNNTN